MARRLMLTSALAVILLAPQGTAAQRDGAAAVVERAGAYVRRFVDGFSSVVATERYVQKQGRLDGFGLSRTLISNVLLVRPDEQSDYWAVPCSNGAKPSARRASNSTSSSGRRRATRSSSCRSFRTRTAPAPATRATRATTANTIRSSPSAMRNSCGRHSSAPEEMTSSRAGTWIDTETGRVERTQLLLARPYATVTTLYGHDG